MWREGPGPVMAELVLNQGPDAVPKARRLVASVLRGCPASVVADAELIVAELATNALLHGAPPVRLRLRSADSRIRIEIEDTGRTIPVRVRQSTQAMTGRGLQLVEAIAAEWGVSPSDGGKTVWAEVLEDEIDAAVEADPARLLEAFEIDALLAAWQDDDLAAGAFTVELGSVPTELLLQAKGHIDNIVRELTLASHAGTGSQALAPEMTALIQSVTKDFADARAEIKRQALLAAERGEPFTELVLTMPLSAAEAGERYLQALDQADRFARTARLLTLAPPRSHRLFREWYVRAIVEQLRAAGSGETPPAPTPFSDVLTAEVDRLPDLEESQSRLGLLQRISHDLATASTTLRVAEVVVDAISSYPGIESVRFYELAGGILRSIGWRGGGPGAEVYDEIPLDADLPGAEVARTGEGLFMRSLAQIYELFPTLTGYYGGERSLHVSPLRVQDEIIGLLALTFHGGEVADDSQLQFVDAIADTAAYALDRTRRTGSQG